MKQQVIIFSDLDGTLLDHHTYSFNAALPALEEIRKRGYPLILISSKTKSELLAIQELLNIDQPFICENGAAIFSGEKPSSAIKCFSPSRQEILVIIHQLRSTHHYKFVGFYDFSLAEIAESTGLSKEAAALAAQREFTEPILWQDTEARFNEFQQQLIEHNLRVVQGGRFFSVMGQFDKRTAMHYLVNKYSQRLSPFTIALGDSHNDVGMLNNADIAVVIQSRHSPTMNISTAKKVIFTKKPGPEGWQEAMDKILPQLTQNI